MKSEIDTIFYKKYDRNQDTNDLIKCIEDTYNEAILYITNNSTDDAQKKLYISYAHVVFSRYILQYVSLEDYSKYIQMKEQIERINNEVLQKREEGNYLRSKRQS